MAPLRLLLQGLLLSVPVAVAAQAVPAADSVVGRRAVPRLDKVRFVGLYDSRYAIVNHHLTTINGLKAGVEFRNRFRTGAAIYFLSPGVPTRRARPDDAAPNADAQLRFRYLAGYAEYVLLETRRWEVSANAQLGLGSAHVRYQTRAGGIDTTPSVLLGVIEPSVAAQFRIFRWAGVGAGTGWRQPIFVPAPIQRELNGPVFYARGKIFLGEFIKVIQLREKLFSQRGLRRPEPDDDL